MVQRLEKSMFLHSKIWISTLQSFKWMDGKVDAKITPHYFFAFIDTLIIILHFLLIFYYYNIYTMCINQDDPY